MGNQIIHKVPVWKISRHRLNSDGFGVTTLVFFYGCPLDCAYCINPETKFGNPIQKCKELSPEDLFSIVNIDNLYFVQTHGGVTFGGGEPLLRHNFIKEFASLCYKKKWRLRIETSLNIKNDSVRDIANIIEHWYVDVKDMDSNIYKRYTGSDNMLVLENLKWLAEHGKSSNVTIRLPHIPGFNDSDCIKNSITILNSMGFHTIKQFDYLTREQITSKMTHVNPMRGKSICKRLKDVRCKIAEKYGVSYTPHECTFEGACKGTCPCCEYEVSMLEHEVNNKINYE